MGDEIALGVLKNAGSALGETAALLVSILDPERIVLTGGLIHGAGDQLFEFAKASFARCVALPNLASKNFLEKSIARVDPILLGAGSRAANLKQALT